MNNINFIAIDFETATGDPASICEAGISVVLEGKIVETRSWLVGPQGNYYSYWNIQIHGIHPEETEDAPAFPEVWAEIEPYLGECPVLVAHNAAFDMNCIRRALDLYDMEKPVLNYYCSLRAARKIYDFPCNKLGYLCEQFDISADRHHRAGDDAEMCALLFLREIRDAERYDLPLLEICHGVL